MGNIILLINALQYGNTWEKILYWIIVIAVCSLILSWIAIPYKLDKIIGKLDLVEKRLGDKQIK